MVAQRNYQGEEILTVGGWKAEVIWVKDDGFYVIHRPGEEDESVPIWHHNDGTAHSIFSVSDPPRFNQPHPADLVMGIK